MSIKTRLQNSLHHLLKYDNTGSHATRRDRYVFLMQFAADCVIADSKLRHIKDLQSTNIEFIVDQWKQLGLKNGTLKNRLSMVRHLASLMNRVNIVPSNQELNIGKRQYKPTFNRAIFDPDFSKVSDPNIRVSLELQRVFGLRREESLKIKPHMADHNDELKLISSWCKGGRSRNVPVRTEEQRYWLEEAKKIAGKFGNSLIPSDTTYIRHRWKYDKQVSAADLKNPHGLRHAYAQIRYKELTGWDAPINGGPTSKELTLEQKEIDHRARMILTEELGHSRKQVLVSYVSR